MVSRFIIFLLLSLSALVAQADALIASVDRDQLAINESVTLTLSYEGAAAEAPDINALAQDFHILGQQQSQRMQITNGQVTRELQWQISLQPKRSGSLTIPAFSSNGQQSLPIQITVSDATGGQSGSTETLYGETDVDSLTPYVQQQIILTRRLIAKLDIGDVHVAPPDFGDALFLDLGSSRYQRNAANGQTEIVIEQRYALFPQRSGELVIPDHYFQAELMMSRGGFFGSSQTVNIPTPALKLQVKPAINSKAAWLPARKVEVLSSVASNQISVGEPFTRTITLRAEGVLAEQLPTLSTDIAGVKRYAEPLTRQNDHQGNTVLSQLISRETLIATEPGELTLPALNIVWYDTAANEWREASAAAQTIRILPAAGSQALTVTTTATPTASPAEAQPLQPDQTTDVPADATETDAKTPVSTPSATIDREFWRPLALALAALLALSLILSALLLYRLRNAPVPRAAIKPHTAQTPAWQTAASQQDAKALYQVLMQMQRQTPNAARQALLDQLSAHLYQQAAANWPHWQALLNEQATAKSADRAPDLAGLYR